MIFFKKNKILFFLILTFFSISLAYSFYFQIRPAVDAAAYDNIAWNLVQGTGYKENAGLSYQEDIAILRVGPGYQFFLAGIYYIFGRNYEVVWIINALLHAFTALLVYLLSREVFLQNWNNLIGVVSALFVGFSPDLITMSGMLMTETLAVFLVVLTAYLFFKYVNSARHSFNLLILLAIIFGFAVLVRTPAALMILPIFYYFYSKRQFSRMFVLIIVLTVIFSPWVVRNYKIYNAFIPTNYAFGYDLLIGNNPEASGELEPYAPAERYVYEYDRVEGNKLALKEALNFIVFNPLKFITLTLKRISIYFSMARPTGFWFHLEGAARMATLVLSAIYSMLIFGLGFWGIYKVRQFGKNGKNRVLPNWKNSVLTTVVSAIQTNTRRLFWLFIMMPLAVVFIIVETRYRFLTYPLLAVFAGFGLANLFEQRPNFKALFAVWGILLLNSAIDGFSNLGRVAERLREFL